MTDRDRAQDIAAVALDVLLEHYPAPAGWKWGVFADPSGRLIAELSTKWTTTEQVPILSRLPSVDGHRETWPALVEALRTRAAEPPALTAKGMGVVLADDFDEVGGLIADALRRTDVIQGGRLDTRPILRALRGNVEDVSVSLEEEEPRPEMVHTMLNRRRAIGRRGSRGFTLDISLRGLPSR